MPLLRPVSPLRNLCRIQIASGSPKLVLGGAAPAAMIMPDGCKTDGLLPSVYTGRLEAESFSLTARVVCVSEDVGTFY